MRSAHSHGKTDGSTARILRAPPVPRGGRPRSPPWPLLGYELWQHSQNAGALAPQDVIRLMNQGATVLDLRAAEAFAAGHINGARHFDALQIAGAGEITARNTRSAR